MAELPVSLPNEIWKPVVGFDNYFVSNMGRFLGRRGGLLKASPCKHDSYCRVPLYMEGKTVLRFAHRLVAEAFGLDMSLGAIDHINGIRSDNKLCNLRACTLADNTSFYYRTDPLDQCISFRKNRATPWLARYGGTNNYKYLGSFKTKEEARKAVSEWRARIKQ